VRSTQSLTLAAIVMASLMGGAGTAMAQPTTAQRSITLCAPTTVTPHQMKHSRVIISRRVRHGFHFRLATIAINGNCLMIELPHTIGWIRWLAADLASQGHFGIGVAYPDAKKTLQSGQLVRYKNDPVTSANSNLPEVRLALGRPAFVGFSAKLVTRDGFDYVGINLTSSGAPKLCKFTSTIIGGLAIVVLDRQVITDEQVSVKICGGSLLTGFPKTKSLDRPLGPRELIADMHSGPALPVVFTVSSLS
jgi:hypothetical protein